MTDGSTFSRCSSAVYTWVQKYKLLPNVEQAPGAGDFYLPPSFGIPTGSGPEVYNYLTLEVHYNNPDLVPGIVDNSGITATYTAQLRPINAGTVTLGDIGISAPDIPPEEECVRYEFTCIPGCTQKLKGDIHPIATFLHMHQIGRSAWTSHYRDGVNLGYTNRIEYWDFGFQHQTRVNYTIKPGDR